jgi:hypothetical protein
VLIDRQDSRLYDSSIIMTLGMTVTHVYVTSQTIGLYMEAWKHGSMEAWKHGSMEAWKHGSMEAWKHGSMEAWKHGSMCTGQSVQSRHSIMTHVHMLNAICSR